MAYSDEQGRVGRLPFQLVKLSCDFCANQYGVTEGVTGGSTCSAGVKVGGQAQAGTTNTITLEPSSPSTDDYYNNKWAIQMTSGAADGDVLRIIGYDGTTKIATVDGNFSGVPVNGDNYILIKRDRACYNTKATCQDVMNYAPDPNINEIYLTEANQDFPIGLLGYAGTAVAIPCLKSVKITPPRLQIGMGLGLRSAVDVVAYDFPHSDNGVDPYYLYRSYNPVEQGTFWGKWIARNPFYTGRFLTVYRGYLNTDGTFDINNYRTWSYIIDKVDGIQTNDTIKITAKDLFKKADDKKAQIPKPSTGVVYQDFLSTDSVFQLYPAGIGDAEYPASGVMRISDEIFDFTRVADDVTIVGARNQYGTTADDHSAGDSVQLCIKYDGVSVTEIIKDVLDVTRRTDTNGLGNNAGIDPTYLDIAGWEAERDLWLTTNILSTILSKPKGVNKILKELTEQNLFYMWWDAPDQTIQMRAIAPVRKGTVLTDEEHFIENSIKVWEDQNLRLSEIWMYYGVRDWSEDEKKVENYRNLYINVDAAQEQDSEHGEIAAKSILSRWITTEALAVQLAGRLLALYGVNVKFAQFKLDNKDDIDLGDTVQISTRYIQDVDGSNLLMNMIIIEDNEVDSGSINQYKAQQFEMQGNYGYFGYSHTGRMEASPASNQVLLDTRTSRWEDPSLRINLDDGICEGPDVAINGIVTSPTPDPYIDVPAWPDNCFYEHIFHIHAPGETFDGWTSYIIDYSATTHVITLADELPAGVTFGADTGDLYHIHVPEYNGYYILLEDGSYLLLETGGFIVTEESSSLGASVDMKANFMWICPDPPPDPPVFEDGSEAYKIL